MNHYLFEGTSVIKVATLEDFHYVKETITCDHQIDIHCCQDFHLTNTASGKIESGFLVLLFCTPPWLLLRTTTVVQGILMQVVTKKMQKLCDKAASCLLVRAARYCKDDSQSH